MKIEKKFIICVGREYGSGGHIVADRLGKKLGIPVYDKNLIRMIAQKHELDEDTLHSSDEKLSNPFFEPYSPYGVDSGAISERLFMMQSGIIREEASNGSAIFVGRCANDILRNYEDVISLFVYAPKSYRIVKVMEEGKVSTEAAADKLIRRMDKTRRAYYQFYTDKKWGTTEGMDLLLNSQVLGIDGCVDVMIQYLKVRGYISE
ncbi:MAG: cytidylate kinase-like family protein [Lachnospiraceae bacterium]|nr:cytidylate kinase-like family protein [Lachnospiraceae bacterium]